jgi:CheY-like chemotaxis protein
LRKRILVADDETSVVKVLIDRLNYWGYEVEAAADGQETLERLESFNPQLLILDLKMPKLGGMQVLEETNKKYPHIGVLILTASPSESTLKTCLDKGAVDYILKPFNPEKLRESVERTLTTTVKNTSHD